MKRLVGATLLSLGLWLLSSAQAFAQLGFYAQPQINPRPVVSPYLNLANGTNPATTYFGIVRPQMEMGQNLQVLQNQLQGMQDNSAFTFNQLGTGNMMMSGYNNVPMTGHPTMFQNTAYYYPLLNRSGGGQGGLGGGQGGMSNNPMNRPSVFNTGRR